MEMIVVAGAEQHAEEGATGLRGPDTDVRAAAAVRRQESDGGQGGHVHQSGQRHPGDQEQYERRVQSGHHLFRMRQQGQSLFHHVVLSSWHFFPSNGHLRHLRAHHHP